MSFCAQESCNNGGKDILPILEKLSAIYSRPQPAGKASAEVFQILREMSADMKTIHYYNCNNKQNELSTWREGQPLSGKNHGEKHFSSKHAYGQLQIFACMLSILERDQRRAPTAAPDAICLPPSTLAAEERCKGVGRFYPNRGSYVECRCVCGAVSSGFCHVHALIEATEEKTRAEKKLSELRAEVAKLATPPADTPAAIPMPKTVSYASLVKKQAPVAQEAPPPRTRKRGGRREREKNEKRLAAAKSAPAAPPLQTSSEIVAAPAVQSNWADEAENPASMDPNWVPFS